MDNYDLYNMSILDNVTNGKFLILVKDEVTRKWMDCSDDNVFGLQETTIGKIQKKNSKKYLILLRKKDHAVRG